jgi:hypothetical protein
MSDLYHTTVQLISSIKVEVKKKYISLGWNFSCFAAHLMDNDRGGPARTEGIHRKERENRKKKHPYKKKKKNILDTHRPSHGRHVAGVYPRNGDSSSNPFPQNQFCQLREAAGEL